MRTRIVQSPVQSSPESSPESSPVQSPVRSRVQLLQIPFQEPWLVKIILDRMISPFWGSWSLDFKGVQRTFCQNTSLVFKKVHWSVDIIDISHSELVLILDWLQKRTLITWFLVTNIASIGDAYVTIPCLGMTFSQTSNFSINSNFILAKEDRVTH